MSKTYKITIGILMLLLLLLSYLEANEPQEINWNPSYSAIDKIPLGTFVLFESLKSQPFKIEPVNIPPFEFLSDTTVEGTYFFLNNRLNFDENELEKLLDWVSKGNTAFLIAEDFSQNILDTLNLRVNASLPKNGISSKPFLNLSDGSLKSENPFLYDRETYNLVFTKYDTLNQDVLGISYLKASTSEKEEPKINFLRDSVGKGAIYIHSTPKAFSNFFLLDENNIEYAEKALAYIPTQKTLFWDQYYKTGKVFTTSPLYIIFNSKALKWAYYFVIIGSILFVFFEGKRKQRSIPIVKPLRNQTYQFTRTIAGLYLEKNDYKSIASKKIALFLDFVRSHFRVPTNPINEDFYNRLAALSDNPVKEVKQLWQFMRIIENKNEVSKEELLQLNEAINIFKRRKNGK